MHQLLSVEESQKLTQLLKTLTSSVVKLRVGDYRVEV